MNLSPRKTTHSWPVICRQSKRYESEDDGDVDEEEDDDTDYETVYTLNNNYQKPAIINPSKSDHLSCRKYLVADYNPKQSSDLRRSTITSVVNQQSEFSDFAVGLKASGSNRLARNSIAPLMSQSQAARRQTLNDGTNVASINTTTVDQTSCTTPPPIIFLLVTLLITLGATGLLCLAVMTDHWEIIRWDRSILDHLTNNTAHILYWHLDDKVARLPISRNALSLFGFRTKIELKFIVYGLSSEGHGVSENVFLVPMHGGIWTLCIDLTENEMRQLGRFGFPYTNKCISYLDESSDTNSQDEYTQHGGVSLARRPTMSKIQVIDFANFGKCILIEILLGMQNLSISCSLVCLIILGSAALLGAFGICQRQISAILVTGVMYLLAGSLIFRNTLNQCQSSLYSLSALFALFTLMIVHFKRHKVRPITDADFDFVALEGFIAKKDDARMAQHLIGARLFFTSWSLDLGWSGVVLCGITYVLWIMLSKIMRYNPIALLI